MSNDQGKIPDTQLSGRWIGATQGCDMPAHVWEISQHGRRLTIETRWEDAAHVTRMYGELLPDQLGFKLGDQFTATLVDAQHFIIPGWDTNDARGGAGPDYDVVFSRPGIAELTAHSAWRKHRAHGSTREVAEDRESRIDERG